MTSDLNYYTLILDVVLGSGIGSQQMVCQEVITIVTAHLYIGYVKLRTTVTHLLYMNDLRSLWKMPEGGDPFNRKEHDGGEKIPLTCIQIWWTWHDKHVAWLAWLAFLLSAYTSRVVVKQCLWLATCGEFCRRPWQKNSHIETNLMYTDKQSRRCKHMERTHKTNKWRPKCSQGDFSQIFICIESVKIVEHQLGGDIPFSWRKNPRFPSGKTRGKAANRKPWRAVVHSSSQLVAVPWAVLTRYEQYTLED